MSATTATGRRLERTEQRTGQRTAPFVIVTDLLPGDQPERHATLDVTPEAMPGVTALPDDPTTNALAALAARRHGAWIGRPQDAVPHGWPVTFRTLSLDPDDVHGYDAGHARETIWPLYHDLVRPAIHERRWRSAYSRVNRAFAAAANREAAPGATVWVHDYHLQLVPGLLRRARPDLRIGFFLSTAFPSVDLLQHMPMHRDIVHGLLGADVLGFQTAQAAENFLRLTHDLANVRRPSDHAYSPGTAQVGVFPTSADTGAIATIAARADIAVRAAGLRASLGNPDLVILSIDALDESQGIERRLRSINGMFRGGDLRPQDATLVEIVTGATNGAADRAGEIALEVARLNGEFASVGRPCVHFVLDTPNLEDRVALYLAADVMMATPLREGANVPALEYIAATKPDGALVLSRFSGTSAMLPEAYLVNPYDDGQIRYGLLAAVSASPDERCRRMQAMREYVTSYDNHAWARTFLAALGAETGDAGETGETGGRGEFGGSVVP